MFLDRYTLNIRDLRVPGLTAFISLLVVIIFCMGSTSFDALVLNEEYIFALGQYWRIVTGNFVHLNLEHIFWDLIAFIILGTFVEKISKRKLIELMSLSSIAIGAAVVSFDAQFNTYCGLSGIACSLAAYALLKNYRLKKNNVFLIAFIILTFKTTYELIFARSIFTSLESNFVVLSHLAGLLTGTIYFMLRKN